MMMMTIIIIIIILCCRRCRAIVRVTWFIWWLWNGAKWPPTLRPSQTTWAVSPPVGCQSLRPPSPSVIITIHPESRYSFYHSTKGRRLSRRGWLAGYIQRWFTRPQTRGAPDPQFSDPAGSGSKPDVDILVPAGSGSGPDPTTLNPAGSGSIPDPNSGIQASYRVFI